MSGKAFEPGYQYKVLDTPLNLKNGLVPHSKAYLAHVSPTHLSVYVRHIHRADKKLLVPRHIFGGNFELENTLIHKFYISHSPFKDKYKDWI